MPGPPDPAEIFDRGVEPPFGAVAGVVDALTLGPFDRVVGGLGPVTLSHVARVKGARIGRTTTGSAGRRLKYLEYK